jgi:hypothetical protein
MPSLIITSFNCIFLLFRFSYSDHHQGAKHLFMFLFNSVLPFRNCFLMANVVEYLPTTWEDLSLTPVMLKIVTLHIHIKLEYPNLMIYKSCKSLDYNCGLATNFYLTFYKYSFPTCQPWVLYGICFTELMLHFDLDNYTLIFLIDSYFSFQELS